MKATVNELWSRGEKVTCGVVTKDTRVEWSWVIFVEIVMSNGHTLVNRREQLPYWRLIQEVSQVSHSFIKSVGYIPVLHCTCEHIHANVFRNVGLWQLWGFVLWKGGWISRGFIFKVEGKTVFSLNAVVSYSCFEKRATMFVKLCISKYIWLLFYKSLFTAQCSTCIDSLLFKTFCDCRTINVVTM